jgi:hypothetical protein
MQFSAEVQSLGISALQHGKRFTSPRSYDSMKKYGEAIMLMSATKLIGQGVLAFWMIEALAYVAHLARIGVLRDVKDDRADRPFKVISS